MEAASTPWRSLGDILVERGLISSDDLERGLAEEAATSRRLADVLVRRGLVTGHDITDALMEQMKHVSRNEDYPPLKPVQADEHDGLDADRREAFDTDDAPVDAEPAPPGIAAHTEDEQAYPRAVEDSRPGFPAAVPAASNSIDVAQQDPALSRSLDEVLSEADERRVAAESQATELSGIGDALERLLVELESHNLTTPPLVRELDAMHRRLRAREQTLKEEIANLRDTREAVERTSTELEQLREDLSGKLGELSEMQATAAMWNGRVADLESDVDSLIQRIDLLSRELGGLVGQAAPTPAMHAVTETLSPGDPENETVDAAELERREGHLLFVPRKDGFELVEKTGHPPLVGESIEVGGATWVVTRVGASPLPFDDRACVFFSES